MNLLSEREIVALLGGKHPSLSASEFIELLQTYGGLQEWKKLRSTIQRRAPLMVMPYTSYENTIRRGIICIAAGAPARCSWCGYNHKCGESISWLCRLMRDQTPEMMALDRASHHMRCYVLLCGIKKFRNPPLLKCIDRFVVQQIAHTAWCQQFYSSRVSNPEWGILLALGFALLYKLLALGLGGFPVALDVVCFAMTLIMIALARFNFLWK